MVERVVRLRGERRTRDAARALAERLIPAVRSGMLRCAFVALDGPLGAGKTAFARGFASAFEPSREPLVASPTYAIVHHHPGDPDLRHADLYRLEGASELDAIGWRELATEPGLVLVEWAERARDGWPEDHVHIRLAALSEGVREMRAEVRGSRLEEVLASWIAPPKARPRSTP